jgi:hypothetical protein
MASSSKMEKLKARAQNIANIRRMTVWVNFTSLGWRIEYVPSGPEDLRVRFDPA